MDATEQTLHLRDLRPPVFFCDPAGTHSLLKSQTAYAAIVGVAQDGMGRIFVRHSWRDKCSTDAMTDTLFALNTAFLPQVFGVEANAMQVLYGDMLAREARTRGIRLPLRPIHQPTTQLKHWRIRAALQTPIAEGRLFFRPQDQALRQNLLAFPQCQFFDDIDALASAVALLIGQRRGATGVDHDLALAAHLRAQGVPTQAIARRLEELKLQRRAA